MSIYTEKSSHEDDDYYGSIPTINSKKAKKIRNDSSKHYPNKDEAKLLRKIMSETGLTEEQVRDNATYRKELSNAQKEGRKALRSKTTKRFQALIKKACQKTGLAPQHPDTIKALEVILEDTKMHMNRYWLLPDSYNNMTAKRIIELYAKK